MKTSVILATLAITVCASAQAIDLSGEWKVVAAKSQGAIAITSGNKSPHVTDFPAGDKHITAETPAASLPFVLKINSQKGNSFHGQWCSPKKCEKAAGVIRKDGTILMVDDDSTYLATMYGSEMDLCVTQPGKSIRMAICHMMEKN